MRIKELEEDFLDGQMMEVLKCEHCGHTQRQPKGREAIEDVHCDKCHMHTDRGD